MNILYITPELEISGFNFSLLNLLGIITILTAILVILSKNPIISVLYLIGLFVGMAIYLVSVGISFLGISYLLVYVGAVSILFLFILMLINVRISELLSDTNNTIPLILVTTLAFSLLATDVSINTQSVSKVNTLLLEMFTNLFKNNYVQYVASFSWENTIAGLNHINSIGNIMYSTHSILLLQVSLILLLAMVGAIVITIKPVQKGKLPVLEANVLGLGKPKPKLEGRGAYDITGVWPKPDVPNPNPNPNPNSKHNKDLINNIGKISLVCMGFITAISVFIFTCVVYYFLFLDILPLVSESVRLLINCITKLYIYN